MYGSGLLLLKILKQCAAKVCLGFYVVQKRKIRYGWYLILLKILKQGTAKLQLEVSSTENSEISFQHFQYNKTPVVPYFKNFQQKKTPALLYFRFLNNKRPQPYLGRTLFQHFQQYKTSVVPHFSILIKQIKTPAVPFSFFSLSGFSFTTIHGSQDCRGRGRAFL